MMTTELYRLRSIDRLLGDNKELETQTIYFAEPSQLNDPMDGFRNLVWIGDGIVWENLFRNYIYSLHSAIMSMLATGRNEIIQAPLYDLYERRGTRFSPHAYELAENICDRVFKEIKLSRLILNLERSHRRIRRDEVMTYLYILHATVLNAVEDVYSEHGLIPKRIRSAEKLVPPDTFHTLPSLIDEVANSADSDRPGIPADLFGWHNRLLKNGSIFSKPAHRAKQDNSVDIVSQNWDLMILDFPRVYIDALERLAYPNAHVASFMRDYGSSAAWAHYAEKHEGVCLVFDVKETSGRQYLKLFSVVDRETGKISNQAKRATPGCSSEVTLQFHEVTYENGLPEIDFFQSIGQLSKDVMEHNWYLDRDGNRSEYYPPLGSEKEEAWRKAYWKRFVEFATTKTSDWAHEKEIRLLLDGMTVNLRETQRRLLRYDFSCLRGLIFGIRTRDSDKLRIIDIVRKIRGRESEGEFNFYQAYYSHEENRIMKEEINIDVMDTWFGREQ